MSMKLKLLGVISCAVMAVSGCAGDDGADTSGATIVVSPEQIQAGLVVFTADAENISAMFNVGSIETNAASACDKSKAVGSYFQKNYVQWLTAQGYESGAKLELDIVDILSYDEYNEAKDVKAYGAYSIEFRNDNVSLTTSGGQC